MAKFDEAFKLVLDLEFNKPENALHYNEGEDGYTFMGVYQKYYKNSELWSILAKYKNVFKETYWLSKAMYGNSDAQLLVEQIYFENYWKPLMLDKVNDQHKANEILVFGINVGIRNCVKTVQRVVGTKDDGIMGPNTLRKLNNYDSDKFDVEFDAEEKRYYDRIIEKNGNLAIYKNGWYNRADKV